jgi:predicted phosphodiesterase
MAARTVTEHGMRLALLSDLHGNSIALDAVLADIDRQGGADRFMVLGDLVAVGYDPVGVLERLVGLPGVGFVQGNTDRYVVSGQRPYPSFEHVAADTSLIPRLVEVAQTFAWTQGMLTAAGWLDWLAGLPLEVRFALPDETVVLATHVAPGQADGAGIHPSLSDVELAALVGAAPADVVCVGHTHRPLDRSIGHVRVINPGSISNPVPPDLRASYAIVEATPLEYSVHHRRVAYDYAAVIAAVERSRHPSGAYIISHFRC